MNRHVGKRLVKYALRFKKNILIALLLLTVAVTAELSGPFIAKRMIDVHILGIEYPWYESDQGEDAVQYDGGWYKRSDHFENNEAKGEEARILQIGRDYYFIDEPIAFDGERSINENTLTIEKDGRQQSYGASEISNEELLAFYQPQIEPMIWLIALYFGLLVFASFFEYGQGLLLQTSANRIIQKMRTDVYAQIQRLHINYFDNLPAGKVVARITNDTEAIRELYVTVLATFFTSIFYMTGIFVALFLLDVKLAFITLTIVPLLVVWIIVYRKYASKFNKVIRARVSDINAMINESIQGMSIIRAFKRQQMTEQEFEELNDSHFTYQNKLLHLNSLMSHNLVNILRNISFVVLIWYFGGASLTSGAVISLGVLYAFVDYLNRLFQPVTNMVNQLANLEQALVAADRVFELLDEEGEDVADGMFPRYEGNVSFDHVSFAYKEDEYVLKNLSFEAKKGQTIALVGHTGSGKSSIMNLLFRFYDNQKGTISIDGKNIQDIKKQELRQHMAIVLQDPFLFTGTIASNVSLDDPSISREKVEKALNDVGADQLLRSLPNGYDEAVIEKGSTLSSGQRQLISFARALAFDPAVLILDEATSNVDTETEMIIQNALDILKKGRTTFIIAHRLSTIREADQILVLHQGEIVERGDHDQLMQKKGRYFQMYQLQQGKKIEQAV
ncbi:ATP-binding cassette domain-containing protein [Bacillus hwajinpoensis]|uniref:ATP-binding cassette domain-containing protein n=1 Tax=Guptibacillus hwajinpoensis TaxID=208199 RepID=A0A845EUQ8_9BACL|nr:ABC transporter ATP-binding protein [Pseudalkalibacillus hwajinpoensis]MYL62656.1 ATP-binding cassette domain-containing protein [Pseudalkalibacillus hwajinpoensis]